VKSGEPTEAIERVDPQYRRVLGLWVSAAIAHSHQPRHVLAAQINGVEPGPDGYPYFFAQKSDWLKRRAGPNPLSEISLHQMEQLERITGYAITDEARQASRACGKDRTDWEMLEDMTRTFLAQGFAPTTVEQELSGFIDLAVQMGSSSNPDREQKVLRRRLGVDAGEVMTYTELGRCFGVSISRIKQIEQKGYRKMCALAKTLPITCLDAVAEEAATCENQGTVGKEASLRLRLGRVPLSAALRIRDLIVDSKIK